MQPRLMFALLTIYAGSAAALLEVGPAVGSDPRPPGEIDPVYGLSFNAGFGPASVYVRGAIMPTDRQKSSGEPYVDEWERRYYGVDVTPLVAFGATPVGLIAGANYRQCRFSDYDYEGGVRGGIPVPFTYTDGEITSKRLLAVGGTKFGNGEGLLGVAWVGVGVAFHNRTGTAWTETPPSERVTRSLDANWKTLELAVAAAATNRVAEHFGITGGFEITNRFATLGDDAPSQLPVGFALFIAPVLQL